MENYLKDWLNSYFFRLALVLNLVLNCMPKLRFCFNLLRKWTKMLKTVSITISAHNGNTFQTRSQLFRRLLKLFCIRVKFWGIWDLYAHNNLKYLKESLLKLGLSPRKMSLRLSSWWLSKRRKLITQSIDLSLNSCLLAMLAVLRNLPKLMRLRSCFRKLTQMLRQ